MKLVEKKCPSCGAQLEFEPEDVKVKCEYCGHIFLMDDEVVKVLRKAM